MKETPRELTPEEQKRFEIASTNYPGTSNEVLRSIGAPHDENPNQTVRRIIGEEAAQRIMGDLESTSQERKEKEEAEKPVRDKKRLDDLTDIITSGR